MRIFISVKTRAKQEKITPVDGSHLKIAVKEAPADGKANEAVCKALAEYFDVPKSSVRIVSGHTGKMKVIEI